MTSQVRLRNRKHAVFGLDGGLGSAAPPWILLQRPVEHSGLHSGQWGAGGFCIFVSFVCFFSLNRVCSWKCMFDAHCHF